MYKKLSFLRKRPGMSTAEFVDYYEHHHVPLILALAATPEVYKRHYVERGDPRNIREDRVDFDVMTEIAFPDRAGATQGLQWAVAVTLWGLLLALVPGKPTSDVSR